MCGDGRYMGHLCTFHSILLEPKLSKIFLNKFKIIKKKYQSKILQDGHLGNKTIKKCKEFIIIKGESIDNFERRKRVDLGLGFRNM